MVGNSLLEDEFMARCTILGDNRRMFRITPDEAAFIKLAYRIKDDPPWTWSIDQVQEVVNRMVFLVERKNDAQLTDFLRHYSLNSLIVAPGGHRHSMLDDPIYRLQIALGLFPKELPSVDTLVVFK